MKNTNWTNFGKRLMALSLALVTLFTLFTGVVVNAEAATHDAYYFPKYTGKSGSLFTALSSVGVDSRYSFRSKIAAANNIIGYCGSVWFCHYGT